MPANIPLGGQVNILERGRPVGSGQLMAFDNQTGEYGVRIRGRMVRVKPDNTHSIVPAQTGQAKRARRPM